MTEGNGTPGDHPARIKLPGGSSAAALPKRFYQTVTVGQVSGLTPHAAFRVLLDDRPIRTPAKRILEAPSHALASALAAEWEAQTTLINPLSMPLTRLVNSALDGVAGRQREVAEDIVGYAGNDLICYRAERPAGLVAQQAAHWDLIRDWAGTELACRIVTAVGIVPVTQDAQLLARFSERIVPLDTLQLAALHVMTTLTGSALIAWAHLQGRLDAAAAWTAAHVDDDWQISQWGEDAEAQAKRRQRWNDFDAACRLLRLLG